MVKKYYKKDSAYRLMTENIPLVLNTRNISEVEKYLLETVKEQETINYIYVIDKNKKLVGVISVKDLFRSPKQALVSDVMHKNPVSAYPNSKPGHLTKLALKHNIKAIPVVNREGVMLGVVPSDVIIDILQNEHSISILSSVGVRTPKEYAGGVLDGNATVNIKRRLPWLMVGIVGGFIAAEVIKYFEFVIDAQVLIAAFIPTIAYVADSIGVQTQTIYIRTLALKDDFKLSTYVAKELLVVSGTGLILGVLAFIGVALLYDSQTVALTLGLSIFITSIIASVIALVIPSVVKRFGYDPAIAAGPFATIIRDILSLVVYFSLANFILIILQ